MDKEIVKEPFDLDERVLNIQQRQKRAQVMRRIHPKIERAREIAKKRLAPESTIAKRAYIQARQIIRRRVAGDRGAEYEKLGPSEKMAIDRAVDGKQKLIKAIALRLIPRVKRAESIRLSSFMKGDQLQNHGQSEGKSKESSGSSSVKESLNALFSEAFPTSDSNTIGQKLETPNKQTKNKSSEVKSKNSAIIQYSKFSEEVEYDTPAFASLCRKSEKSGIDIEVLGEVYDRGWNVWTEGTNVSQQQYAFARVNSFINQGKTYFNEDSDLHEVRAAGTPSITRYKRPDGTTALKSLNKWGKRKDWQDTEGGLRKAREHSKSDLTNEGLKDPKDNPCWKNYKPVGTKKLRGKTVPNCVPEAVEEDSCSSNGTTLIDKESNNSRVRKKIEAVDRAPPHTEYSKQAQIKKKIIDEQGNSQPNPKKRLIGTDSLVKAYKKDTPCESKNMNEARKTTPSIRNTKKLIQRLHDKEQGQTYGGAPYSSHPKSVMRLGIKVFGGSRFDQQARKAALLHDTIEDTPTSPETLLKKGFHPDVVNAVSLLSKDKTKSYEENIAHIANGNTPAHKIAQMVKYVDNMSNYLAPPKSEWEHERVKKQKDKYMKSMQKLGGVLGVDHHENLQPSWKLKEESAPVESKNINESFNIAFASGIGVTLTAADLGIRTQSGFKLHPSVIEEMERMKEEVRSSDTEGVVVHTASGKTIVRKQKANRKIIGTGNLTDGKPDDTL